MHKETATRQAHAAVAWLECGGFRVWLRRARPELVAGRGIGGESFPGREMNCWQWEAIATSTSSSEEASHGQER